MDKIIEHGAIISLMITAIYYSMQDGEIFGWLATLLDRAIDWMASKTRPWMWNITKPLYRCNICMGGIWTLIIYPALWGWEWTMIPTAMTAIGMNVAMAAILKQLEN